MPKSWGLEGTVTEKLRWAGGPPGEVCSPNLSFDIALPGQTLTGPAVTQQPRIEQWWIARYAEHIGQMKDGEFDLLMVGDSITHNWESVGAPVWKEHFADRKAINLGCGGE